MILAHGVGGLGDLPLPVWLLAYTAGFALLIAFVALPILWPRPRLSAAAIGRPAPPWFARAGRAVGPVAAAVTLGLFVVVLVAAWFGVDSASGNLAPTAMYVAFWAGLQALSAVAGDGWDRVNPLRTLARGFDRLARRDPDADRSSGIWATHWPAAAGLLVFQWLELAYHEPSSTAAVGWFLSLYTAAVLLGATVFGAGWVRTGDGFAVLFSLLAALAPVHRDDAGRLRLRWPGAGVASVAVRPGTMAVVLVVIGGTVFDGFSRTGLWADQVGTRRGWEATTVDTVGLLLVVATVSVLFLATSRAVAITAGDDDGTVRQAWRWVPALVPVALAYSIAHHASRLVFEWQSFLALLSDPLGEGWDLFGTATHTIDYTAVSPNQIAYAQLAAIVVGHVAGMATVYDRAIERFPSRVAIRSQYPMVALMAASTIGSVLLLLDA